VVFEKPFFKFSCVCLLLEKLINGKYFPINEKHFLVKEKFDLIFRKVFSFYFRRKTLSGSCEKFRNVILFVDYIKFDPQTFNCYIYIYILFWIFVFQFHLLEFNFYINFDRHFYNCYLLFSYHFLIEIFYLSNLILILLIVTYFIWNHLWNVNCYYFNFFIF
jgi:hypothetical protein